MADNFSPVRQTILDRNLPIDYKFANDPPLGKSVQRSVSQADPEEPRAQGKAPWTSASKKSVHARKVSVSKKLEHGQHNMALENFSRSVGDALGALYVYGKGSKEPKAEATKVRRALDEVRAPKDTRVRKGHRKKLLSTRLAMKLEELNFEELLGVQKGIELVKTNCHGLTKGSHATLEAVSAAIGPFVKASASKLKSEQETLAVHLRKIYTLAWGDAKSSALKTSFNNALAEGERVLVSCRLPHSEREQYGMLRHAILRGLNDAALLPYDMRKHATSESSRMSANARQALMQKSKDNLENLAGKVAAEAQQPSMECEESVLEVRKLLAQLPMPMLVCLSGGRTPFPREALLDHDEDARLLHGKSYLLNSLICEEQGKSLAEDS